LPVVRPVLIELTTADTNASSEVGDQLAKSEGEERVCDDEKDT
jgi:hypothetical protein